MPKYFYTAKSLKGESKIGTKEATSESELARILREQGLILISAVLEEKLKKRKITLAGILGIFKRVSLTDLMLMTRNLQVMISAGVSLPRALKILALQAKNKKLKEVLAKIREGVLKGKGFSESLAENPQVFPEIFWNMIKVGEEAGTLDEVLKYLSQQLEREYELKSKIKGAMIYPAVLVLAIIGIGLAMLIIVVPKLAETFRELEIELPLTTKIVIGLGNFLAQKWYFVLLILAFIFFIFYSSLKTKMGKRIIDRLFLCFPIISPIVKKTNSAYSIRTLSNLIASGVPLVRSLEIISGATGNFYFKEALKEASQKVQKGEKLSQSLSSYQDLFSSMVLQMIEVGEETGETSSVLTKLADFFEEEVANTTKNLVSVIEPILLLLIGGAIGFFAVSMVQPMYSMLGGM